VRGRRATAFAVRDPSLAKVDDSGASGFRRRKAQPSDMQSYRKTRKNQYAAAFCAAFWRTFRLRGGIVRFRFRAGFYHLARMRP
jgi:hypothetical protein